MTLRPFLLALVAGAALALIAGTAPALTAPASTPPPGTPPPLGPATVPTSAPTGEGPAPVVMVYPFDVQTGVDPKLGVAIATILGQEMAAAGGITVPAIPSNVKRADFLDNARNAKADFYISGYVVPVGETARVVEQVVSTDSGVILFSATAQVTSVADVASQSLLARTDILAFVGRGTQTVQTQPSNTPAPTSTNGANMPISGLSNIVDSVFKHKGPTPRPSAAPTVKPSRGVIVAPVTASTAILPAELSNATHELYFAMNKYFVTQMSAVTTPPAQSGDAICGADRDNTIATGTLQETTARKTPPVTFNLSVYTCFGAPLEQETGKGTSIKTAVDAAVAAYAAAHPDNS